MSNIKGNTADLEKELAALRAENAALKLNAAKAKPFSLKVSEKGALSIYGLGRFPVTLYLNQAETLLANVETIKAFIEKHRSQFSVKPPKGEEKPAESK